MFNIQPNIRFKYIKTYMHSNKIDIIIPIYNETYNIFKSVLKLKNKLNFNHEIILCYDHNDKNFIHYKKIQNNFLNIQLIKNDNSGPCEAVKTGLKISKSDYKIIFPCDDINNFSVLNLMSKLSINKYDVIVPSRFIEGGSMKNCPLIKSIIVRLVSKSLNFLKIIPVKDASNGFRFFSKKFLDETKIESKIGFSYSLELLIKSKVLKKKIKEVPCTWEERKSGKSNFKILKWAPAYIKWYIYGLLNFYR